MADRNETAGNSGAPCGKDRRECELRRLTERPFSRYSEVKNRGGENIVRVIKKPFSSAAGRAAWLNKMAGSGWRLRSEGWFACEFERCEPAAYEYMVRTVCFSSPEAERKRCSALAAGGLRVLSRGCARPFHGGRGNWRSQGSARKLVRAGDVRRVRLTLERRADGAPFPTVCGDKIDTGGHAVAAALLFLFALAAGVASVWLGIPRGLLWGMVSLALFENALWQLWRAACGQRKPSKGMR